MAGSGIVICLRVAPCKNNHETWRIYPVAEQLLGSQVGL